MPRRRSPKVWQERVVGAIESMIPGTVGGRIANAGPIGGESSAVRASVQGGVATADNATGVDFYEDQFDLTVDGAQDLALTYEPLKYSEHVVLRGARQRRDIHWTRDGRTLSLLTDMDARSGDAIDVAYAYVSGAPVLPAEGSFVTLVDWSATGWKYNEVDLTDTTDYSAAAFDDSGWSTAQAAFGGYATSPGTSFNTAWTPNTSMWLRRTFAAVTALRITVRIDNSSQIWVDDALVLTVSGADIGTSLEHGPFDITGTFDAGTNTIAVRADDEPYDPGSTGNRDFIDVKIEGILA